MVSITQMKAGIVATRGRRGTGEGVVGAGERGGTGEGGVWKERG